MSLLPRGGSQIASQSLSIPCRPELAGKVVYLQRTLLLTSATPCGLSPNVSTSDRLALALDFGTLSQALLKRIACDGFSCCAAFGTRPAQGRDAASTAGRAAALFRSPPARPRETLDPSSVGAVTLGPRHRQHLVALDAPVQHP